MEAATPIHIYPLGGLGEVGKNMTVYECCGDMIIVDCGLVFPDNDMFGVDMVIPDFTFVVQLSYKCAYFLTDVCAASATMPVRSDAAEQEDWSLHAESLLTDGPYRASALE